MKKKWRQRPRIWILTRRIWFFLKNFQAEVIEEEERLESPLQGFESKIWRIKEHMKNLNPRKKDSNPIYRMKLLVEDQAHRFESPIGNEFKYCIRDSNPWVLNSNSPCCSALNAWSEQLITLNFKDFLFHNC